MRFLSRQAFGHRRQHGGKGQELWLRGKGAALLPLSPPALPPAALQCPSALPQGSGTASDLPPANSPWPCPCPQDALLTRRATQLQNRALSTLPSLLCCQQHPHHPPPDPLLNSPLPPPPAPTRLPSPAPPQVPWSAQLQPDPPALSDSSCWPDLTPETLPANVHSFLLPECKELSCSGQGSFSQLSACPPSNSTDSHGELLLSECVWP